LPTTQQLRLLYYLPYEDIVKCTILCRSRTTHYSGK